MRLFSSKGNELNVPEAARSDSGAYECVRIWMVNGAPAFSLEDIKETGDPRAWGSVLADLSAYASSLGSRSGEHLNKQALAEIQKMFNHLVDHWLQD